MANTITQRQGCWIQYQLKLKGLTYKQVAKIANRSSKIVSHFLRGRKGSEPVKAALAKILSYEDFDLLLDAVPQEPRAKAQRGGAA